MILHKLQTECYSDGSYSLLFSQSAGGVSWFQNIGNNSLTPPWRDADPTFLKRLPGLSQSSNLGISSPICTVILFLFHCNKMSLYFECFACCYSYTNIWTTAGGISILEDWNKNGEVLKITVGFMYLPFISHPQVCSFWRCIYSQEDGNLPLKMISSDIFRWSKDLRSCFFKRKNKS